MNTEVTPEEVEYLDEFPSLSGQSVKVAEEMKREFDENEEMYRAFREFQESAEITPTNVRKAAVWVATSIKTDTDWLDDQTSDLSSGNFANDKEIVEGSTDGRKKWEMVNSWFPSDLADQVAEAWTDGRVSDGIALLAGRDPETGEARDKTYLRTCKASLVAELLGVGGSGVWCLDSRRWMALEPVLKDMLHGRRNHTQTDGYRSRSPGQNAEKVPTWSHSADGEDRSATYLEDRIKWNPDEYHAILEAVAFAVSWESDVPMWAVPQVAFNLSGNRTFHPDLQEMLK